MTERYLRFDAHAGERFAISREIRGKRISLVQDSYMDNDGDIEELLNELRISMTPQNLDCYFPYVLGKRCPTLELMEKTSVLDPTNPIHRRSSGDDIGV